MSVALPAADHIEQTRINILVNMENSANAKFYLRPDVQIEPLIDRWYAWSHLIPPSTAARNLTHRHLKIMDSYICAPEEHAKAVADPHMLGGPFVDYKGKRVEEIALLRNRTIRDRKSLVELSKAIADLSAMLRSKACGFSLQPLYREVPSILRGYVELTYDLDNHPSFRIIEPLLYRSRFYDSGAQSLMLSLTKGDDRPFVLSTPRLDSPDSVNLQLPFDDERVDWMARLSREPQTWNDIRDRLASVCDKSLPHFMFRMEAPKRYERYYGSAVRWRYFGHACILIETPDISIMFDPVLSYTYDSTISRYTYEDIPDKIDFVLITHNHQDHVLLETILQIRHKVGTFIVPANGGGALQDPSLKLILQQIGCRNVIEVREMESVHFGGGSITALPFLGEHGDLNVLTKAGYLVRVGAHALMFLADSCNIEPALYQALRHEIGDCDGLFLGMECDGAPLSWIYGPLVDPQIRRDMDQSRRLAGSDFRQAMEIVRTFNCKEVYVYAMGQEPWLNHVMSIRYDDDSRPIVESNRLIRTCQSVGIRSERLFGEREMFVSP